MSYYRVGHIGSTKELMQCGCCSCRWWVATGCSVGVNDIRGTSWDGYKLVMDQCDISYNMVTCGYDAE